MSSSRKELYESITDLLWLPKLPFLVRKWLTVLSNYILSSADKMHSFQEPKKFSSLCKVLPRPFDFQSSNGSCSSLCTVAASSDLQNWLHGERCGPTQECYRNCKYKRFVDLTGLNRRTDRSFCNSFISDSNSCIEDRFSQDPPSSLHRCCSSSSESWTSSSNEMVAVSLPQMDAHQGTISPFMERYFHGAADNISQKAKLKRKEVVSPLFSSLFHNVPPSIRFRTTDEEMHPLPIEIRRMLHWKLSSITPVVVRQMVVRSGFRLARKSTEWSGTWGKHMKSIEFRFLKEVHKVNHFPGSHHLGRKDNLLNHIRRSKAIFSDSDYSFLPETYILPKEVKQLHQAWKAAATSRQPWIVKPPASARGSGIYVICKWSQVPKKQPSVIQRYICNPYLINGSKFDLRVYVLVTDFNPLKIYVYPDGLVRFASVKYSTSLRTLSDRYMHLTNYSVNKKNSAYISNEDENSQQGHKWSLKALWSYLKSKGVDVTSLWEQILDIVVKTIISAEGSFNQLIGQNVSSHYTCFELFGFDIMLDDNLKPSLLEVNISPSLHAASNLDASVKIPLVKDMFNIVGYHIPDRMSSTNQQAVLRNLGLQKTTAALCINKSYYRFTLTSNDKLKQERFLKGQRKLSSILEELTPDDVRHLMQSEDELARRGNFVRVFPSATSLHYLELMLNTRYYNLLLLAWEIQYFSNREEGIRILQSYAEADYHLKSSWKMPLLKEDWITSEESDDTASDSQTQYPKNQELWTGTIGKVAYKTKKNGTGLKKRTLRKAAAYLQSDVDS